MMLRLMLCLFCFICVGCADPVKEDLQAYQRFIKEVAEMELEVNTYRLDLSKEMSDYSGQENKSEAEKQADRALALQVFQEKILPRRKKISQKFKAYQPKTPELVAVHQMFITYSIEQYEAERLAQESYRQEVNNLQPSLAKEKQAIAKRTQAIAIMNRLRKEYGLD